MFGVVITLLAVVLLAYFVIKNYYPPVILLVLALVLLLIGAFMGNPPVSAKTATNFLAALTLLRPSPISPRAASAVWASTSWPSAVFLFI